MTPPDPTVLAHDLRNVMGAVRAMAMDLKNVVVHEPGELPLRLEELEKHTDYAMEALRVVERQADRATGAVHLGAWAWALRLWVRSLSVGDLAEAPRVLVNLGPALEAGVALVRAIHPTRPVSVEALRGLLRFEASTSAQDTPALSDAIATLTQCGLSATIVQEVPCVVTVEGRGGPS